MKKNRMATRKMAECAIMIAASVMLSMIKIYEAPLGGSVTLFSMTTSYFPYYTHKIQGV